MAELFLQKLDVYKISHQLGDQIWTLVSSWNDFNKFTLGKQLIRSADSISLNICEGYGRFHFKEKKQFCYYSRGSLYETTECLKKAGERKLITEDQLKYFNAQLEVLGIKLNNYIKSIGVQPKSEI